MTSSHKFNTLCFNLQKSFGLNNDCIKNINFQFSHENSHFLRADGFLVKYVRAVQLQKGRRFLTRFPKILQNVSNCYRKVAYYSIFPLVMLHFENILLLIQCHSVKMHFIMNYFTHCIFLIHHAGQDFPVVLIVSKH